MEAPLKGAELRLKSEIPGPDRPSEPKIMGHGSSRIFTDKLFQVRLAAESAAQHGLQKGISLFFAPKAQTFICF